MSNYLSLLLVCNLTLYIPAYNIEGQLTTDLVLSSIDRPTSFISEWETATSWDQTSNIGGVQYSLKRSVPQLQKSVLEEGVVLVYTKGYSLSNNNKADKPLLLPFYFFLSEEKVDAPLHWSVLTSFERLEIQLQMTQDIEQTFLQGKNDIQLRYFILDKGFLKKHNLSPRTIRNMSYQQVVTLMSITP